ncbi:MAG: hypothetical protein A2275_12670 [Bacteroidetes bacterium RIFOXYA12_FULL_35_11]|nr:MAG: hypothetical protein A2X01_00385 [Bacteroidetes bacterium GWF2_35_48]OFY74387.1 MAG: hypothetical protein A2275_12670 [Bacteroidetes bacterium RIFOXYA12_FULL_35_11]OFY94514.1 MAG: hypothetical protein A2491_20715 [Bacteroidetes bacterium RIFOXYC12_FULL_35_7]OFY96875.1 MAG: hypothetical protein A2309_11270 [Bacteroidetes bacterium RIFOXYB2_FULL_35_7]HBX53303.1 hypothetical protein [Bacteroidales bacterium]
MHFLIFVVMKKIFLPLLTVLLFNISMIANTKLHSDSIDVLHYKITLNFEDYINQQISGNTELRIASKINNLDVFCLDLLKLNVDSVKINSSDVNYTYNDTLLKIQTSGFSANDTFLVTVFYHGHPVTDPSGWGGFYFYSGGAYNLGVGFADYPHCYGRTWFPCVDDFVDRALYDLYIITPFDKYAVCGGTLQSVTNNDTLSKTYHWKLNNSIPTYLTSVAVGDYAAVIDTFNGIQANIPTYLHVRPADTTKAKNSFINLNNILAAYEDCFGPYRWERVGYVGVPFNSGAMEHATNIAYPNACIDNTLYYEELLAHELSHHWFGNLITCKTDSDMWINEGWATYCEEIFRKHVTGHDAFKSHVRARHAEVVRYLHVEDSGYRAVYGLPLDMTYCSTVYQKGANVVHTLENYLGDSLFFSAVKAMLDSFAYNNISSIQMRDFLSQHTGVDLTDFFDFFVFSPGFTHYSIDSFIVTPAGQNFDVNIYVRQRLKGVTQFANSNKFEITFMDSAWQQTSRVISFNGETGNAVFSLPFYPVAVMADLEEKTADATVDNYKVIKTTGTYAFDKAYFTAIVSNLPDSAFLRIEHNWVAPDGFKTPHPSYTLSPNRYYKVDGILSDGFLAKGKFSYNATPSTQLDHELLINTTDSIVIFFRENSSREWRRTKFTKTGNAYVGFLTVDTLYKGEYALATYSWISSLESNTEGTMHLNVYPNPTDSQVTIEYEIKKTGKIEITNSMGKIIYIQNISKGNNKIVWDSRTHIKGEYFVTVYEGKEKISVKKLVLQ